MNFFKIITLITSFIFIHLNVFADSHDNAQNIVEKAKEINQKVKKEQAIKKLNAEAGEEEPLPLNDPFVGDGSLGGGSGIKILADSDDEKRKLSLFNFKLVGVMEGQNESYASLIDENGDGLADRQGFPISSAAIWPNLCLPPAKKILRE